MAMLTAPKPVIAICDDDDTVRQLSERVLNRSGQYKVVSFCSGKDLIKYAGENPLNLVLLDV